MMNLNLEGKVVVVTGGAGLLGEEFIKAIAGYGGIGIIADINEGAGKKFLNRLKKEMKHAAVDFIKMDITCKRSIHVAIGRIVSQYGVIDALVNSAYPRNKNYGRKFEDVTYEDFCENVNLHLGGYFLTCQQFASFFKKQGHGHVINIASIYGVIPPRFEIYQGTKMTIAVEYAAVKSAIIHLTKYMAKYFKNTGIRFNCISPGGIWDDQPKRFLKKYKEFCLSKGLLDKEDLNGTLLYLLSDVSSCISGQNIIVDDGFTL